MTIEVRRASVSDADRVALLFDSYRQFYGQASDPPTARAFIYERLALGESVVFLAEAGGVALGFTQLFPLFNSTAARRLWLLNDLYVVPEARQQGVGRLLMSRAGRHAVETGAWGIELATAHANTPARTLYESLGYRRDEEFLHYALDLSAPAD
jgi:ribosomal protein S18 acetylase RimI-like enzyme